MRLPRGGPKLARPRVPRIVRDLVLDLRDRRLLPLLGVIVAATLAVPFVLGEEPSEEGGARIAPLPVGGADEAGALVVAPARSGLRDYRRRLAGKLADDPFVQRYTAPVLKGAKLPEPGEPAGPKSRTQGGGGGEDDVPTGAAVKGGGAPPVPPLEPSGGGRSHGNGSGGGASDERYSTWRLTVEIARTERRSDGSARMGAPRVREGVRIPAALPSAKRPVVVLTGVNPQTGRPLLAVSDEVRAVFGDAKCVVGGERCQLLELQPGFPEVFVHGEGEARLRVKVAAVEHLLVRKRRR